MGWGLYRASDSGGCLGWAERTWRTDADEADKRTGGRADGQTGAERAWTRVWWTLTDGRTRPTRRRWADEA